MYPRIAAAAARQLNAEEIVVDGEMVACGRETVVSSPAAPLRSPFRNVTRPYIRLWGASAYWPATIGEILENVQRDVLASLDERSKQAPKPRKKR
jgi:hypothetical protein